MGQLLIGFALLIVVASLVIVAAKVYSGGGPKGLAREAPEITIPASEYSGE